MFTIIIKLTSIVGSGDIAITIFPLSSYSMMFVYTFNFLP